MSSYSKTLSALLERGFILICKYSFFLCFIFPVQERALRLNGSYYISTTDVKSISRKMA